jgi:uncharacterized protein DUF6881
MEYVKVSWIHDFEDEPILLYSELDLSRHEIRKIEIYKDGSFGLASFNYEFGGTLLSSEPVPDTTEIGKDPQFIVHETSKEEFEAVWEEHVNILKSKPKY